MFGESPFSVCLRYPDLQDVGKNKLQTLKTKIFIYYTVDQSNYALTLTSFSSSGKPCHDSSSIL